MCNEKGLVELGHATQIVTVVPRWQAPAWTPPGQLCRKGVSA